MKFVLLSGSLPEVEAYARKETEVDCHDPCKYSSLMCIMEDKGLIWFLTLSSIQS